MFAPPFTLPKVIVLVALAVVVWVAVVFRIRRQWSEHRRRREMAAERGVRREGPQRGAKPIMRGLFFLAVIGLSGLIFYVQQYGTPAARARLGFAMKAFGGAMFAFFAFAVALLLIAFAMYWWRRDRVLIAAVKFAEAGKLTEAGAMVRGRIAEQGPTHQRLTVLGLILMQQERFEEARAQFEAALQRTKRTGSAKNNLAIALWKLGRHEDAMQLLEQVCQAQPNDFTSICNLCLLLAEMGRDADACERLEQAERIYERYDSAYTKVWLPLLEKCRQAAPVARGFPVIPIATPAPSREG
jgi:tetratricopeptide (TPR) repeat protein